MADQACSTGLRFSLAQAIITKASLQETGINSACCKQQNSNSLVYSLQAAPQSHATWLAQRPDAFEFTAQSELLSMLEKLDAQGHTPGFGLHLAHVSSADCLPLIAAAKERGQYPLLDA